MLYLLVYTLCIFNVLVLFTPHNVWFTTLFLERNWLNVKCVLSKWSTWSEVCRHWLFPSDMHFLNSIHPNYNSLGVCDSDLNAYISRKVGKGGVALLWKKSLDDSFSLLSIDSDRIIGIQIQTSCDKYTYVLQVYMPSSNHSIVCGILSSPHRTVTRSYQYVFTSWNSNYNGRF